MEFRQPSTVVSTTAPTTVTTGTNYSSQKMAGMKQCRSNPDLEVDSGGPFKLLRKDSSYWSSSPGQGFLGSQTQLGSCDLKMNMSLNSDGSSFVCSPTSSCISDSAFLDCGLVGESRSSSYNQQMRPGGADLMMALNSGSNNASSGYGDSGLLRPFSYQAQPLGYGYRSNSGPTLLMGRESIQSMYGISPTTITASSGPFTSTQWAELEHQALIFKYMMAGANVPPDLLYPIRKSVAAMAGVMGHHPTSLGWGNFHLGMANNPDPEPGRCRRTDGKKWRCSREVVPDQKYCERHMHRGRNRSKKNLENNSAPAGTNSQGSAAVLGSNNADSNPIQASNPPSSQLNRPQIGSNLPQKPIHQLGSSIIGGSGQFNPIPQLQSAAAAQSALGGTKDYRFGVAEQGVRLMGPCLNVPESKLFCYGGGLRGRYVDLEDNAGQLDGMLGKGHNFFENGPLGEALQSRKNWGLNLLCDGWDSVPTSPKGVLQKSAFASLSDTSSSASSPIL